MKTITIKYGGKVWNNVQVNNSGWIAPGAPKDLVELLKNAPRTGYTSKNCPIVRSDDGTNIYLGAAELHKEDESIGGGSSGTRTPRSTAATVTGATQEEIQKYQEVLEELIALKPSKKLMEYFAALRPKTTEEIILRQTLEAQGFSSEQIEMVITMQQKNLANAAKKEQATA